MDSNLSTQLLAWFNALSIPTVLLVTWKISRWIAKKETDVKASFDLVMGTLVNLRDNHFHHVQETLNDIKAGQDRATEQMTEHTAAIVAAQNASKDAIVQAIISTRANRANQ